MLKYLLTRTLAFLLGSFLIYTIVSLASGDWEWAFYPNMLYIFFGTYLLVMVVSLIYFSYKKKSIPSGDD